MGVSGQSQAPAALSPRKSPGTHYTGSWVGPRAGLKGNGEVKIPGFEPRNFQLLWLRSPGSPYTLCSVYDQSPRQEIGQIHRSPSFPKMCSRACVAAQKKTSDYPSTHSRAFAFPHDMTHTVVARFATDIFVRLCCPQWFARFSDFETPIRTRTRHHPKPLDRKRWFFAILQVFAVHNRKQHSFLFQQMSLWTALQMFIPSQYRSHYIPPATLTKLSPLSGRYREILITAH